jgi:hypothetical protein
VARVVRAGGFLAAAFLAGALRLPAAPFLPAVPDCAKDLDNTGLQKSR